MKISLVINSKDGNVEYLKQLIISAEAFDEIVLYLDGVDLTTQIPPSYFNYSKNLVLLGDGKHRSVCEGFNFATEKATGDWICVFCDDDYFISNNLKDLIEKMRSGEYDDADVIHFPVDIGAGLWGANPNISFENLMRVNQLPCGSFFKKDVFCWINGFQVEACSDWDFWLRAMKHGYKFKYYSNPVYFFRTGHKPTLTQKLNAEHGTERIAQMVRDNVNSYNPRICGAL